MYVSVPFLLSLKNFLCLLSSKPTHLGFFLSSSPLPDLDRRSGSMAWELGERWNSNFPSSWGLFVCFSAVFSLLSPPFRAVSLGACLRLGPCWFWWFQSIDSPFITTFIAFSLMGSLLPWSAILPGRILLNLIGPNSFLSFGDRTVAHLFLQVPFKMRFADYCIGWCFKKPCTSWCLFLSFTGFHLTSSPWSRCYGFSVLGTLGLLWLRWWLF